MTQTLNYTMSKSMKKAFVCIFRYIMIPMAMLWTLLMAYATSVYVIQETLRLFQSITWKIHLVAICALSFSISTYALFRHMIRKQDQPHEPVALYDNNEEEEEELESVIEL